MIGLSSPVGYSQTTTDSKTLSTPDRVQAHASFRALISHVYAATATGAVCGSGNLRATNKSITLKRAVGDSIHQDARLYFSKVKAGIFMRHRQGPTPAEVYEQYLGPTISDPWTQVLLEHAAPQPGEHALDVACGTGSVARHVAPLVDTHGKIVALDVNPDMLAIARALPAPAGATIAWQQANAISLGLADGAFDLVLCQQGLQFFPDRIASVREMRRVLTKGGRVAISVWQALHHHPVYEALMTATARHLGATLATVDVPFSLYDAEELHALLSDAGFQRLEVIPRSLIVHFPAPERFVQLTVQGAATSIPAFAQLDDAARDALVEAVIEEAQPVAGRYLDGGTLTFPMHTHIAMAYT